MKSDDIEDDTMAVSFPRRVIRPRRSGLGTRRRGTDTRPPRDRPGCRTRRGPLRPTGTRPRRYPRPPGLRASRVAHRPPDLDGAAFHRGTSPGPVGFQLRLVERLLTDEH